MRASPLRFGGGLREPWTLLLSGLGGGLAWAAGAPILGAGVVTVGMLGAAAGVAALTSRSAKGGEPRPRDGTVQAGLIDDLDRCLADLRTLRADDLPDAVETSTVEALTAADGARRSALRVAVAADTLDAAIERAQSLAGRVSGSGSVRDTVDRMSRRRDALLVRLRAAVDEVAELYARLLELTATVNTLDVGGDVSDIGRVNDSITALQDTFAELEAEVARVAPPPSQ